MAYNIPYAENCFVESEHVRVSDLIATPFRGGPLRTTTPRRNSAAQRMAAGPADEFSKSIKCVTV